MTKNNEDVEVDFSRNILNLQDVLEAARKASNDSQVNVLNYSIHPYSSETLGYTGSYHQLKIKIQQSNVHSSENLSLFVKAIPENCVCDDESLPEKQLFNKEAKFFKILASELSEISPSEKWSPTCYLIKNGVIVMEDLRLQGYKLLGLETFDDYRVMKSTFTTLAHFHSCSILLEAKRRKESRLPVVIGNKYPDICKELAYDPSSNVHTWVEHGINLTISLGNYLGYNTKKLREAFNKMYEILKPSKIHRNILCHGDLWMNNLMYNDEEKCVFVDFQGVRYVPLAVDILQLLHLNTSSTFRQKYECDLVEFYHSALQETVSKNDLTKIAKVPTLDEILFGLKDLRLYGSAAACLYFPTILIDANILDEGTQKLKGENVNMVFRDRTNITLKYIKKDVTFKKKIDDAISELVKISETL